MLLWALGSPWCCFAFAASGTTGRGWEEGQTRLTSAWAPAGSATVPVPVPMRKASCSRRDLQRADEHPLPPQAPGH